MVVCFFFLAFFLGDVCWFCKVYMVALAGALMAFFVAAFAGRCRRRNNAAALRSTYSSITVDESRAVPMVETTFGSEDQI